MSINPLNDISAVYMQEVFKPQLGKSAPSADGPKKVEKGKDDAESSAKRIRQATYDIRYRARREDIKLDQAFNQYMGHTTMSGPEKAAVKEKLGLTDAASSGGSAVKEEVEGKKFKVRVTDKESGKSYVRYATREKINQLRANPNISSVEMTGYGSPYEGEKKKGEKTAAVKSGKGLDPVGQEDKDIDNDGDHDKTDKYLLNRRKVRGAAIAKRDVKEGFSDWREDLREVLDVVDKEDNEKKITGLKSGQKNNIKTSALKGGISFKETVEAMGGELIEMVELDEGMTMKDFKQQRSRQKQKEKRAADKIAPNRRKDIHTDRLSPERAVRHRANVDPDFEGNDERNYPGGKLKNPKKIRKAKALGELGEEVLDEKAVSKAQQRFMGMVYAVKKGEKPMSPEVAAAAKGMTGKEARKFAKTKHAGLPEVKEAAPNPVSQKQQDTQNMQQDQQRAKLQDRKLAAIQKTQLAAKMKQVQSGIPLKDSYDADVNLEEGRDEDAQERRFQKHGERSRGETATKLIGKATRASDILKSRQKKTKPDHPKHQELGRRVDRMSQRVRNLQQARQNDTSTFRQGPVGSSRPKN